MREHLGHVYNGREAVRCGAVRWPRYYSNYATPWLRDVKWVLRPSFTPTTVTCAFSDDVWKIYRHAKPSIFMHALSLLLPVLPVAFPLLLLDRKWPRIFISIYKNPPFLYAMMRDNDRLSIEVTRAMLKSRAILHFYVSFYKLRWSLFSHYKTIPLWK